MNPRMNVRQIIEEGLDRQQTSVQAMPTAWTRVKKALIDSGMPDRHPLALSP